MFLDINLHYLVSRDHDQKNSLQVAKEVSDQVDKSFTAQAFHIRAYDSGLISKQSSLEMRLFGKSRNFVGTPIFRDTLQVYVGTGNESIETHFCVPKNDLFFKKPLMVKTRFGHRRPPPESGSPEIGRKISRKGASLVITDDSLLRMILSAQILN